MTQKGYKLHSWLAGVSFVSRYVKFYEEIYPYHVHSVQASNKELNGIKDQHTSTDWHDDYESIGVEESVRDCTTEKEYESVITSSRR